MRILIFFSAVIFLSSCSPKIIQSSRIEKDSVIVDTIKTSKIVKRAGDTSTISFNLAAYFKKVDSLNKVEKPQAESDIVLFKQEDPIVFYQKVKSGNISQSVSITQKGNVKINCKEDSLQKVIDQLIINKKDFKTVTITKAYEVTKPPTKFQEFCKWFTVIILGLLALYFTGKVTKFIP